MKKVKFFFIEYVPASNGLDDFDEVARFILKIMFVTGIISSAIGLNT